MTHSSPSVEFVDAVSAAVRGALHALDQHENDLAMMPGPSAEPERVWNNALTRLEDNLGEWQNILGSMSERVHAEQADLNALDADLRQSLDMFATARKHLEGQAASGLGA